MQPPNLFLSGGFECGYFPNLTARHILVDPEFIPSPRRQEEFAQKGFRRSGNTLYYPGCGGCGLCIPCRINIANFTPARSQRRCFNHNLDLKVDLLEPEFDDEMFELYAKYQKWKHKGGGMDEDGPQDAFTFIKSSWADTRFVTMRNNKNKLLCVAVTDFYPNSMSAVYTFYHPKWAKRSLGTYAVLLQVNLAKINRMDYLYLGFYIKNSPKMRYKANFRPLEILLDGTWRTLT